MKYQTIVVLALACLTPLTASAQEGRGPCRADVERLCAESQGDPKATTECLLDHQNDIADACYDKLKQQLSRARDDDRGPGSASDGPRGGGGARACKQDVETLCQDVKPGGGRIVDCLLDHQKDLSDACYEQMSKRAKRNRN